MVKRLIVVVCGPAAFVGATEESGRQTERGMPPLLHR